MATTRRENATEKRMSIAPAIKALEGVFDKANKVFYNGELELPVITFSADDSKKTYGHITVNKVWHEGERSAYELNIVCNMLESNEQVIGTLLHEMAHEYALNDNEDDEEHEIQVSIDVKKGCWMNYIDGELILVEPRDSWKAIASEVSGCGFEDIIRACLYAGFDIYDDEGEDGEDD